MKNPFKFIKDLAWLIRVQAEMLAELGKQQQVEPEHDASTEEMLDMLFTD